MNSDSENNLLDNIEEKVQKMFPGYVFVEMEVEKEKIAAGE